MLLITNCLIYQDFLIKFFLFKVCWERCIQRALCKETVEKSWVLRQRVAEIEADSLKKGISLLFLNSNVNLLLGYRKLMYSRKCKALFPLPLKSTRQSSTYLQ